MCAKGREGVVITAKSEVRQKLRRVIFLSFCLFAIVSLLSGCEWILGSEPIPINEGFSDALKDMLRERYELEIPDSAEFESGQMEFSLRDPFIEVYFSVPEADFHSMFSDAWKYEIGYKGGAPDDVEAVGDKYYTGTPWAQLYYTEPVDGRISAYFYGVAPDKGSIK